MRNGRLTVIDHAGTSHVFGSGGYGPSVAIRFTDQAIEREIFFNPELKSAEAYMDGRLVMEGGSTVFDLLKLFSVNRSTLAAHPMQRALRRAWRALRRRQQRNPIGLAAQNIRHHYDIPPDFYRLWLDETMTYSCAYYTSPEVGLHQAANAKLAADTSDTTLGQDYTTRLAKLQVTVNPRFGTWDQGQLGAAAAPSWVVAQK